ncbi:MAG: dipeptidase [Actinomycetota bacterium]
MREVVRSLFPGLKADLERLVSIPSVSAPGFDPANLRRSAELVASLFAGAGLDTRLLEVEGAPPAVLATFPAPAGAPTVLLYAHHDVQPPGDLALWVSPPFEPTERGGRLYGRGAGDNKSGIAMHLAAVRAFAGKPPVGLKVFIEGEEETGSEHLGQFLSRYGDGLAADVCVLADSGNIQAGIPTLTTSLRGLVDCVVEVRTLDHAVHSGVFGGPFPDALTVLCRLLATLHDEKGTPAVGNRAVAPGPALDIPEEIIRTLAGVLPGVEAIGEGGITERMWARPSISVLAIDAPRVAEASNQLVPVARAKVSMRIAPGDDPRLAMDDLAGHLEQHAPWGARVTVTRGSAARPFAVKAAGPAYEAMKEVMAEAWGCPAIEMGLGGSIPFVAEIAEAFPEATLLLVGAGDPDTREHGENESVLLADLEKACLSETLLLAKLGEAGVR